MNDERSEAIDNRPALVVGATGKQGGAAVRALLEMGIPVRALIRDPDSESAKALAGLGASLAVGDLFDEESLVEPCTGVRAVFSVLRPDMMNPLADAERTHARNLIRAAVSAGVPHFVQTTASGVTTYLDAPGWSEGRWQRSHHDAVPPIGDYWTSKNDVNEMVRQAGFPAWTLLLPSMFMEMFIRPSVYFEDRTSDQLVAPVDPDTTLALIAVEDIGRAAAAAIADPGRFNQVHLDLAGDVLTIEEVAQVLTRAWGTQILAPQLPMTAGEALAKGQVAPIVQSFEWIRDAGYPAAANPERLRSFGIDPVSFENWATSISNR